jgi:hypothetical protein
MHSFEVSRYLGYAPLSLAAASPARKPNTNAFTIPPT